MLCNNKAPEVNTAGTRLSLICRSYASVAGPITTYFNPSPDTESGVYPDVLIWRKVYLRSLNVISQHDIKSVFDDMNFLSCINYDTSLVFCTIEDPMSASKNEENSSSI